VALTLTAIAGCSTPSSPDPEPSPAPATPPPASASDLVALTNGERTRAGVSVLRMREPLMQAAQLQADQIAASGRLEHTLPDARYPRLEDRLAAAGYAWQAAGENLAFGQSSPATVLDAWMRSESHRANILNANFTEIGTAHAVATDGRPYYVQVFAHPARTSAASLELDIGRWEFNNAGT
jgi:uncharacterized protein YkwD